MAVELNLMKKMSFGDIFEWSFKLLKKHFIYIIKSMSYFFIPGVIISILSVIFVYPYSSRILKNLFNGNQNDAAVMPFNTGYFFDLSKIYSMGIIIFFIYYLLYIMPAFAASVKAINIKFEQKNESELNVTKYVLKKYLPLLLTTIIAGLMCTIGFCLCGIPGIVLMIYMIFIPQIILLENKSFFKAIGRSFSLVNNNFWVIFLILLVFLIFYYIISSIISIPFFIVPYIKSIMNVFKSGGESDPSIMLNYMDNFFIFRIIILGLQFIISIFFIIVIGNALTLKYHNIKNLKEGTQLLNKLDKEIKGNEV